MLVLVVVVPPIVVAALVARRTERIELAMAAGAWTGMISVLVNLVAGLTLVLIVPSRVPLDPSVLRHGLHTPQDILAGNVGEDLAGFISFLFLWPLSLNRGLVLGGDPYTA